MNEDFNERIFKELESVQAVDHYTEKVTLQAKNLESFMSKVYNDPDRTELEESQVNQEATERITLMNQECPHIGQPVTVTGEVVEPYVDTDDGQYKPAETMYYRREVWSAGYMVMLSELDDGQKLVRVGHLFHLGEQPPVILAGTPLMRLIPTPHGFAPVGAVDIETFGLEGQHDTERLQRELPELYKEFHGRIANSDDECVALHNLTKMRIPEGYDVPEDTLRRFESYAHERLGFDYVLPYQIAACGLVNYSKGGSAEEVSVRDLGDSTELLVVPEQLAFSEKKILAPDGVVIESRDRHWSLAVRVLGEAYDDNADLYGIPLSNILGMQSLRKIVHQGSMLTGKNKEDV